jgi:hypothetical protein
MMATVRANAVSEIGRPKDEEDKGKSEDGN